ncbi:MAG: hypothetical protein ACREFD_15585 [Stellaceae bacterium]
MTTNRAIGARRMWIRRWRESGKIDNAEARRMTRELDTTPVAAKSKGKRRVAGAPRAADETQNGAPIPAKAEAGALVTLQYDPTKYRVEFHRLRRKG